MRLQCGVYNFYNFELLSTTLSLMPCRKRLHPETSNTCPLCDISTHTIRHIMEECPSLDPLRYSHTTTLYGRPLGPSVALLRSGGLLDQN